MTLFLQVTTLTTLIGNPNRDKSGRPKELMFGGSRRQRMSSQAIKRSVRHGDTFRQAVKVEEIGMLTRSLPGIVAAQLDPARVSDEGRLAIMDAVSRIGTSRVADDEDAGDDDEDVVAEGGEQSNIPTTRQAMFFTVAEAKIIAERLTVALEERGLKDFKKLDAKGILAVLGNIAGAHGVWTALFGRMTTASPLKDIDAAVSMAHSFGTHAHNVEFDFYTAVDDLLQAEGKGGAAYLDSAGTPFAGTTFHGYFAVDVNKLVGNLGGSREDAVRAVRALVHGGLTTLPGGMGHRFAHFARPDFTLVELIDGGQPVMYANAFLKPVRPTYEMDQFVASREALLNYVGAEAAMWGQRTRRAYLAPNPLLAGRLRYDDSLAESPDAVHCGRLPALLDWVERQIKEA